VSDQLIVAGFHRSGTSLVCQLLQSAGLFFGYDLLGANFSNPHGHFEDTEILELHEQMLADNGQTWLVGETLLPVINGSRWRRMREIIERRNGEHELWGFKDPRACLFLMAWKHLLPDAKILLVYRHFSDSTYSLARRRSTELFSYPGTEHLLMQFWEQPDLALRMWLVHNNALLAFARTYPEDTLIVSFDKVRRGFPVVDAINRRWDLGLDDARISGIFDPTVTVERRGRQPVSDSRLIPKIEDTWRTLEQLSRQAESEKGGTVVVEE
jgi:hypothetical protein